jgi:iron(III) transport system substrate-binding protein
MRIGNEAKAGRMRADVFDSSPVATAIKREGLALKWRPEGAARLGARNVDAEGFWTATNLYVLTPAFNTDLVKRGTEPRTWDDLLDPKWKGRMAWNAQIATAGAAGFIGLVLTERGEKDGLAYLRRLAGQNVVPLSVTARQVVDMVMAGEYAIALQIFNNHPVISAAQGAPIDWIPMNPAFEYPSVVGITKGAPHENAAKLFVDFLISPEGQTLYRNANYMPADPAIPARDAALRPDGVKFRSIYFTPEKIDVESPKWIKIYQDLFR